MNEELLDQQDLVTKFFAGEISDSEFKILKAWLEENPENRRIFDKENELWQETAYQSRLEHFKVEGAWLDISSRLGLGKKKNMRVTVIRKSNLIFLVAAASVACLLAIWSLFFSVKPKAISVADVSSVTTVSTKEGEKAHIFLPDSTEIILNSGSSISYDAGYNIKDRNVKFSGEAYFIVATNRSKPFLVNLDRMKVIATGTKFNIFSFGNEDRVETTLEEGAISVSIPGSEAIKMKSGEQIVYFVRSKKIQVSEVATDTYTSWKENKLRFNDTPFEEVLRRIGRKYNVRFEITSQDLLNLKYTATFIDESVEEVMQMLQTVSPITYKIYNITTINDKKYTKPKIVVGKRKELKRNLNPKP
jgi:transmembrane sensor